MAHGYPCVSRLGHLQDEGTGSILRSEMDYSAHRGLPDTLYGFDTLELAPTCGSEAALEALAGSWGADTANWVGFPSASSATDCETADEYRTAGGDPERVVLSLWWD